VADQLEVGVDYFRRLPKSDLHNHSLLGGNRRFIERLSGHKMAPFRMHGSTIYALNDWIRDEFRPVFGIPGAFEKVVGAAFIQAKKDGVRILEMSLDAGFSDAFGISPEKIRDTFRFCHETIAPEIDFRPELGFARSRDPDYLMRCFERFIDLDFFCSIDLYDDEFARPPSAFLEIFRLAKSLGLRCKAHAGEFGSAASVRETAEILELDAIQHGISAAKDRQVMQWLADHRIPLNVCPASNIRLRRAASYATHPIRPLFVAGVIVTINTDDVVIFGNGVSEQYLKLYRSGAFSLEELETIRLYGLESAAKK
jgi:adenosine deaminase